MNRTYLALAFCAVLLVATCIQARAADLPVDCEIIKLHIAQHGKAKAIAWALSQGYGWRDIYRIRRLCGV